MSYIDLLCFLKGSWFNSLRQKDWTNTNNFLYLGSKVHCSADKTRISLECSNVYCTLLFCIYSNNFYLLYDFRHCFESRSPSWPSLISFGKLSIEPYVDIVPNPGKKGQPVHLYLNPVWIQPPTIIFLKWKILRDQMFRGPASPHVDVSRNS